MNTIDIILLSRQIFNYLLSLSNLNSNYLILIPRIDFATYSIASLIPEIYVFQVKQEGWTSQTGQNSASSALPTSLGLKEMAYNIVGKEKTWSASVEFVSTIISEIAALFSFLNIPYSKPTLEMVNSLEERISSGISFIMITPHLEIYLETTIVGCNIKQSYENGMVKTSLSYENKPYEIFTADLQIKEIITFDEGF